MLLPDHEIEKLCNQDNPLLTPYSERGYSRGLSHGVNPFGHDLRLSNVFSVSASATNNRNESCGVVDPEKPERVNNESVTLPMDGYYLLKPGQTVLANTIEVFNMPDNLTGLLATKSTYLRHRIQVLTSVIEAGWRGSLTLEIANLHDRLAVKLHVNSGIAQVLFLKGKSPCRVPYPSDGKYQDQEAIPVPSKASK